MMLDGFSAVMASRCRQVGLHVMGAKFGTEVWRRRWYHAKARISQTTAPNIDSGVARFLRKSLERLFSRLRSDIFDVQCNDPQRL